MSDDYKEIDNLGNKMLRELNEKEIKESPTTIVDDDPFYNLKIQLLDFFKGRMEEISAKDKILKLVTEKIEESIEVDEPDLEQLQSIYRMYSQDSRNATDSLLALFKPTPGTPSILADSLGRREEKVDVFDKVYEEMSHDDLEKLSKFLQALQVTSKEDK